MAHKSLFSNDDDSMFNFKSAVYNWSTSKMISDFEGMFIEDFKMKSIQMIVYTYFLINSNVKVEMVNARNKLKAYKGPVILTPYEDIKKINIKIINI